MNPASANGLSGIETGLRMVGILEMPFAVSLWRVKLNGCLAIIGDRNGKPLGRPGGSPMSQRSLRIDKQRRLDAVDSLARAVVAIQIELIAYRDALAKQLTCLRDLDGEAPPEAGIGEKFQKLLGAAAQLPADRIAFEDRRTSRRRVGNPISIYIADEMAVAEPIPGWVMDRSSTGLGLWVDEEEPVGTLLRVRPVKTKDPDWWTQVVVRHCRAESGRYVVGCQFVDRVPWNQLKLFG
jgi:hypothetical protein